METAIIFVTLRVLSSDWNTFGPLLVRVTGGRSEIKTMILAEREMRLYLEHLAKFRVQHGLEQRDQSRVFIKMMTKLIRLIPKIGEIDRTFS